jgi:hypothetical protein
MIGCRKVKPLKSEALVQTRGRMQNPPGLGPILRNLGISAAGIDKIQFGSGVVGKLTTSLMGLYVVCLITVFAGAYMGSPPLVGGGLAAAFLGFVFTSVASMLFASRNPAAALLEGGDLVRYRASGERNIRSERGTERRTPAPH